jgi:hypothetical protein
MQESREQVEQAREQLQQSSQALQAATTFIRTRIRIAAAADDGRNTESLRQQSASGLEQNMRELLEQADSLERKTATTRTTHAGASRIGRCYTALRR